MAINRHARGFLLSVPVGAAGGAASGFLIILLGLLISAFGAAGPDLRGAAAGCVAKIIFKRRCGSTIFC